MCKMDILQHYGMIAGSKLSHTFPFNCFSFSFFYNFPYVSYSPKKELIYCWTCSWPRTSLRIWTYHSDLAVAFCGMCYFYTGPLWLFAQRQISSSGCQIKEEDIVLYFHRFILVHCRLSGLVTVHYQSPLFFFFWKITYFQPSRIKFFDTIFSNDLIRRRGSIKCMKPTVMGHIP